MQAIPFILLLLVGWSSLVLAADKEGEPLIVVHVQPAAVSRSSGQCASKDRPVQHPAQSKTEFRHLPVRHRFASAGAASVLLPLLQLLLPLRQQQQPDQIS